ncbi:SDR family oxidoreductase [Vibrio lentus]|nr:SDR family oxidoreductase [Vibrio lentus]
MNAKAAFDIKFWGSLNGQPSTPRYMTPNSGSITRNTGHAVTQSGCWCHVKTAINATLRALTKVLAKNYHRFRVNAVSPGLTMTGLTKTPGQFSSLNHVRQHLKNNLPAGKVGEAKDIAMGYLFAINNPYVTGSVIDIDGGALYSANTSQRSKRSRTVVGACI